MEGTLLALLISVGLTGGLCFAGILIGEICRQPIGLEWSELWWPPSVSPKASEQIMSQLLLDLRGYLVIFEARATAGKIRFLFGTQKEHGSYIRRLIMAFLPGSDVTPLDRPKRSALHYAARMVVRGRYKLLQAKDTVATATGIITALSLASKGEELVLQVALHKRFVPQHVPSAPKSVQAQLAAARASCSVRVGVRTSTVYRRRVLLDRVKSALRSIQSPEGHVWFRPVNPRAINRLCSLSFRSVVMNAGVLSSLVAWPLGSAALPGTGRTGARVLRGPKLLPSDGRTLAHSTAFDDHRPLTLSRDDGLHHLHIMGPTGVGKSTLLLNLICQDMAANKGVIVIDPKGDLIANVLERIPEHRQEDVAVFDPTDSDPIGLNPLDIDGREPEVVVDTIVSIFHRLYADSWGPRTQDILYSSLLTLVGAPNASLVTLPFLLTNRDVRARILDTVSDPIALGPFWQWYDSLSEAQRHHVIAPVMNKLRAFLLRPHMRAVIGQIRPQLSIREVFDQQKIFLVSLAKGSMGYETSSLLGSLLLAEIWQTALERFSSSPTHRTAIGLYLDEFQDYLHLPTDLVDMLSKARAGGIAVTLAHQHFSQLTSEVKEAVLSNVRSQVYFQLSPSDANVVAGMSQGVLSARDFQLLKQYQVYANLLIGGRQSGFMSGKTFPQPTVTSEPGLIRAISRDEYGASADDVDAIIREISQSFHDPATIIGRRKRYF